MKASGGADTAGCAMLITSAVAIIFSVSSSDTCPRSDLAAPFAGSSLDVPSARRLETKLLAALFFFLLGSGVIYFYTAARTQGTQHFIAAGHDLVTLFKSLDHFNIGRARDTGVDWHELGFVVAKDKYALNFLLVFILGRVRLRRGRLHRTLFILWNQIRLSANRQRLNWN